MNNTANDMENDMDKGPWYKQFWAWFILSPLIVVVIVSSITVTLAVKYKDDRVVDNYYKEGRMINMRLDEDLLASQLSVQANIEFDPQAQRIYLALDQKGPIWPESLSLELSHPVKAEMDHAIAFQRTSGNQYQAQMNIKDMEHRWYLRLLPIVEEGAIRWRLRGEIDFTRGDSIILKPDV